MVRIVVGWLYIRTAWRFLSQPKCLGEKLRNSERLFYIRTQLLEPNQVTIRIANNGLGIREDAFKQIFNPFFTTKPVGRSLLDNAIAAKREKLYLNSVSTSQDSEDFRTLHQACLHANENSCYAKIVYDPLSGSYPLTRNSGVH